MRMGCRQVVGMLGAALLALSLVAVPPPAVADEDGVPNPEVEGPIEGGLWGRPWHSSVVDIEPYGFVEEEFFFSGTSEGTPYKTRMVVRRPADGDFSGSVFVDWINVTGGTDLETMWPPAIPVYLQERHAYVGLTAQLVGVNGLKVWDPVRYASLVHPGDTPHSYNILAQAVQALRAPEGVDPLGGIGADRVIVGGASQSAGRLHSYISGGYPIVGHIDGFYLSRSGGNAEVAQIAADLEVPMIKSLEENLTAPDDHDHWVVWEGAGQAHAPLAWHAYVWDVYQRDLWHNAADLPNGLDAGCAMNQGTVQYQVRAALHWMHRWVADGDTPPSAPRVTRDSEGNMVRDADGNVLGGLRYPFIEVPLGLHTSGGCPLFGHSRAWSRDKILERYPTHADYYAQVEASVNALQAGGFLLPSDAAEILDAAAALDVWNQGSCWHTANPDADEAGPVTSVLGANRAENSPVGYGAPAALAEVSCSLASLGL